MFPEPPGWSPVPRPVYHTAALSLASPFAADLVRTYQDYQQAQRQAEFQQRQNSLAAARKDRQAAQAQALSTARAAAGGGDPASGSNAITAAAAGADYAIDAENIRRVGQEERFQFEQDAYRRADGQLRQIADQAVARGRGGTGG